MRSNSATDRRRQGTTPRRRSLARFLAVNAEFFANDIGSIGTAVAGTDDIVGSDAGSIAEAVSGLASFAYVGALPASVGLASSGLSDLATSISDHGSTGRALSGTDSILVFGSIGSVAEAVAGLDSIVYDQSGSVGIAGDGISDSYSVISDHGSIGLAISGQDDNILDNEVWAFNAQTGAGSYYTGWVFDSVMEVAGRFVAVDADGLYELTGSDDDGTEINDFRETGIMDFGVPNNKCIPEVILGAKHADPIVMNLRFVRGGVVAERWYQSRPRSTSILREEKIKPGEGIHSRYFVLGLGNQNGDELEVESITINPLIYDTKVN